MPASSTFQVRSFSDNQTSTLGASATQDIGVRQYGFAARTGPSTVQGATGLAVASIVVTPASATVEIAATTQLTAVCKNSAGDVLPDDAPTSWASEDDMIATVSAGGLVTGVGEGEADITAIFSTGPITSNVCVITVPAP